jgi:hypothetical protein
MSQEWSSDKLRVLPPDYPEQARRRIQERFGLSDNELDAWFKKMRRPYDDPRRTPSKRALLETIRQRAKQEASRSIRATTRTRHSYR